MTISTSATARWASRTRTRGFETVTLLLDGAIYDRDEGGVIEAGEVQWMTAGRGIIHGENVATKGKVRLLQLWLTLPKEQRWTTPGFSDDQGGCGTRPPRAWCGGPDIQRRIRRPAFENGKSCARHDSRDHDGPSRVTGSGDSDLVQRICVRDPWLGHDW